MPSGEGHLVITRSDKVLLAAVMKVVMKTEIRML